MELLVGLILPPVIEVVNKDVQNDTERYIVAMLVCVVVAVGIDYKAVEAAHLSTVLATIGILATEAQTIFKLYWGSSFLRSKLQEKIGAVAENSTNRG